MHKGCSHQRPVTRCHCHDSTQWHRYGHADRGHARHGHAHAAVPGRVGWASPRRARPSASEARPAEGRAWQQPSRPGRGACPSATASARRGIVSRRQFIAEFMCSVGRRRRPSWPGNHASPPLRHRRAVRRPSRALSRLALAWGGSSFIEEGAAEAASGICMPRDFRCPLTWRLVAGPGICGGTR